MREELDACGIELAIMANGREEMGRSRALQE